MKKILTPGLNIMLRKLRIMNKFEQYIELVNSRLASTEGLRLGYVYYTVLYEFDLYLARSLTGENDPYLYTEKHEIDSFLQFLRLEWDG